MSAKSTLTAKRGLLERLDAGAVICAEGYLFELERRGYLQAGPFVPEVVLEHPDAVTRLHEDFVHAGSEVVEAFTYYAHRQKLRVIGREDILEKINRQALRIAKDVADRNDCLMAGNICNTNAYEADDRKTHDAVRAMFEEQIGWAVEEGADFLIAETIDWCGEAEIALDVMKKTGLPTVVTLSVHREEKMFDGVSVVDACKRLEAAGADVVGLNCQRGPKTLMPVVRKVRDAISCHVAALPVPYRTTDAEPTFQSLTDRACSCIPGNRPFPTALDPFTCNRYECAEFAREAFDLGVRYIGLCCGAAPHHIRAVAEALGRSVPGSRYSPDMSRHAFFGSDAAIPEAYKGRRLEI
ncbi:homocysteine S-methyltransferase family protein [Mesorhizobium sp. B2-1-3A]|uniref:homocysteine S-methyltransferase family protein n=1 Tax=Mesorhizobium sp. B2-1-3A TaxID=2589971 RepID=UPI00112EE5E7|nr:homocysteine S-methyltransferase family protein [Mesorhizobium sp. B2-1-3A]TPM93453.1 homocysteine S-methyltransferase family protein [Mesorhizobium sp. B2-1-3A]